MTALSVINFNEVGALYKDAHGRKWEIRKQYGEAFMIGITAHTPTFREPELKGISIAGLERTGIRNLLKEVQTKGFRGVDMDETDVRSQDVILAKVTAVYE
jgi:spore germination protein YaaH